MGNVQGVDAGENGENATTSYREDLEAGGPRATVATNPAAQVAAGAGANNANNASCVNSTPTARSSARPTITLAAAEDAEDGSDAMPVDALTPALPSVPPAPPAPATGAPTAVPAVAAASDNFPPVVFHRGVRVRRSVNGSMLWVLVTQTGEHWAFVRKLGDALLGSVKLAVRVAPSPTLDEPNALAVLEGDVHKRAVKVYKKARIANPPRNCSEDYRTELSIMQAVAQHPNGHHPHVLPLLGAFETEDRFFAFMPFCEQGELFNFASDDMEEGGLGEMRVRSFTRQLVSALQMLHGNEFRVAHRDVSLENMLVTSAQTPEQALVMDFGLSVRMPCAPDGSVPPALRQLAPRPRGPCGKIPYMAPEVLANREPYDGFAADMWAAGICCFILLAGFPPMEFASAADDRFRIVRHYGIGRLLQQWQIECSPAAADFIAKLVTVDPTQRLTAAQAMMHPFLALAQPSVVAGCEEPVPALIPAALSSVDAEVDGDMTMTGGSGMRGDEQPS